MADLPQALTGVFEAHQRLADINFLDEAIDQVSDGCQCGKGLPGAGTCGSLPDLDGPDALMRKFVAPWKAQGTSLT